jgi:hypothetical protein
MQDERKKADTRTKGKIESPRIGCAEIDTNSFGGSRHRYSRIRRVEMPRVGATLLESYKWVPHSKEGDDHSSLINPNISVRNPSCRDPAGRKGEKDAF